MFGSCAKHMICHASGSCELKLKLALFVGKHDKESVALNYPVLTKMTQCPLRITLDLRFINIPGKIKISLTFSPPVFNRK